jgi:hypothetical protein
MAGSHGGDNGRLNGRCSGISELAWFTHRESKEHTETIVEVWNERQRRQDGTPSSRRQGGKGDSTATAKLRPFDNFCCQGPPTFRVILAV